ncbi:MAG: TRAP transporter substrate-binding protein [Oscillospiraceae bacterium]|nr:TRAP transporter substrate-binding protein [Oscillospiraceae bacterium]
MKKALALVLAAVLCLALVACGSTAPAASSTTSTTTTTATSTNTGSAPAAPASQHYTINIGHGGAESTAQQVGCLALKEYLESHGDFTVNIYGNNSMGNDDELCQMVQSGNLEMCLANSIIVNYVPDAVVYDTFYNFKDIEAVKAKFMEDETFLNIMREKYAEAGFYLGGYSVHGFRVATANKALTSPAELKGLTFRVMQNDLHIEAWQDMGATPTPFSFSELYTALQQGTIDAQENPIELIYSQKFYEQQSFITLTNHLQQCQQWLMNPAFYNALSDENKAIVDAGIQAACEAATSYALDNEASWSQQIKDYGCTIVELTPEQMQVFKDAVAPEWQSVQSKVAPEVWAAYTA